MDLLQVILLAIVQGLAEFLPVSSSAHLLLLSIVTHSKDQGLLFTIALHLGTLIAVLFYFRFELYKMIRDWCLSCLGRGQTSESRLMWAIGFATIPVGLAGLIFGQFISDYLRNPLVIGFSLIIFALFLGFADHYGRKIHNEYQLNWKTVLFIGIAQVFALIPGASRSGTTMTAGLLAGLTREGSARFSFLLSIPIVLLAAIYEVSKMTSADWAATDIQMLMVGVIISALTGLACIHVFLKLITRIGMMPFVIYRVFLGGLLIFLFW